MTPSGIVTALFAGNVALPVFCPPCFLGGSEQQANRAKNHATYNNGRLPVRLSFRFDAGSIHAKKILVQTCNVNAAPTGTTEHLEVTCTDLHLCTALRRVPAVSREGVAASEKLMGVVTRGRSTLTL